MPADYTLKNKIYLLSINKKCNFLNIFNQNNKSIFLQK
jgi:hypothetical protein